MAIDQTSATSPLETKAPAAIENEFPTYRAISSGAVLSLILGFLSVFCYADLWFLLLVACSVVFGTLAIRKIRRMPDVLTGTAIAQVGIGLGLLFGLTAVTILVSQEIVVNNHASAFAKDYVDVIRDKSMPEALWYQQAPAFRNTKTPQEIADDLKGVKSPASIDPYTEKTRPIQLMKDRLKGKDQDIHFVKIESKLIDGLTVYANALVELHGPATPESPKTEQYALFELIRGPKVGPMDWMVKEVRFPYTPASTKVVAEKKGDGHGH